MKIIFNSFLFIFTASSILAINGCGSQPPADNFHLQKKYWDEGDYQNMIDIIEYVNSSGSDKLPCYAVPASKPAFIKLVDPANFKVVMDDEALGLNHRNEFSQKMFGYYKKIFQAYQGLDKQDKFIYPREFAEVLVFGLDFQLSYFKLGNEHIVKESDNPNSQEVKDVIKSNVQTLVNNYTIDLELVKREKAFTDEALGIFTAGIDKFFTQLITEHPDADYSEMLSKASLMEEKAETPIMKSTLTHLITLLEPLVKGNSKKEGA